MTRLAALMILLLGANCSTAQSDRAASTKKETAVQGATKLDPQETHVRRPDSERTDEQCASLAAAYMLERNNLLAGDRGILRKRLDEIGGVYKEKMKMIPGCSFSVL